LSGYFYETKRQPGSISGLFFYASFPGSKIHFRFVKNFRMKEQVYINEKNTGEIAGILSSTKLDPAFYQRPYLSVKGDREQLLRMHFFAVAICHQTHTLHSPKHNLWGWDYLEHGFLRMVKDDSRLLQPNYLVDAAADEVARGLASYFSETGRPEDTTLDRLPERVLLMQEASRRLSGLFNGEVSDIFRRSGGYLFREGLGIYELLDGFEAFRDPMRKKSTFFLKLITEAGLATVHDPENYIPIMDYHMQRVLLRTGCVEVADGRLRQQLLTRDVLPTDEPVRSACIDALRKIAAWSGHPITKMNDFFWTIGRSCCNETTLCHDGNCAKAPCSFEQIALLETHNRCIFQDVCPGVVDPAYRKLWQPMVETHFY
jgi:hypothetical protein